MSRWPALAIWPTDRRFTESPDAGLPECVCSRCGEAIREDEIPLRCWPEDGRFEYRYHMACVGGSDPGLEPEDVSWELP